MEKYNLRLNMHAPQPAELIFGSSFVKPSIQRFSVTEGVWWVSQIIAVNLSWIFFPA